MINPPSTHFSWKDLFWLVKKKRDPFMRDCLLGHELNYLAHVVSFNTQEVLRHVVCLFIKNSCNVWSFGSKQSTILIFKIGFPVASCFNHVHPNRICCFKISKPSRMEHFPTDHCFPEPPDGRVAICPFLSFLINITFRGKKWRSSSFSVNPGISWERAYA